jgi:hypothetical protein
MFLKNIFFALDTRYSRAICKNSVQSLKRTFVNKFFFLLDPTPLTAAMLSVLK